MDEAQYGLPNINSLSDKANGIYKSLVESLLVDSEGKFIAIEVDSGDHFIGVSKEEAVEAAKQKYPSKIVFVRRIGAIEKLQQHSIPLTYGGYNHARIF